MSIDIFPVFDPPSQIDFKAEGKVISSEISALDQIADKLDVKRLSLFADNREVPPEHFENPDSLDEFLSEWNEWFSPADCLNTLNKMLEAIENQNNIRQLLDHPNYIVDALADLKRCLELAEHRGLKFRLEAAI